MVNKDLNELKAELGLAPAMAAKPSAKAERGRSATWKADSGAADQGLSVRERLANVADGRNSRSGSATPTPKTNQVRCHIHSKHTFEH